ncbi:hypothetical protein FRC18_006480 [Serendipita sp. 400]|nr:hypothetical protein FRC18_006480 [Serendipita sp. 400]
MLLNSSALDHTANHVIEGRRTSKDSGGRDLNVDAFILNIPDVTSPSVMKTIAPTK